MNEARATQGLDLPGFDRRGLVCGYALSDSRPLRLDGVAACGEAPVWLHFNIADARARKWLTEQAELPAPALDLLLEPHPRVRVTLVPGGVAAILHDLHHDFREDPEQFGELRFYLDERRVISARRAPLRSVDRLRRELEGGRPWCSSWPLMTPAGARSTWREPARPRLRARRTDVLADLLRGRAGLVEERV